MYIFIISVQNITKGLTLNILYKIFQNMSMLILSLTCL